MLQWVARLLLWVAMGNNDVTMRCYGVDMGRKGVARGKVVLPGFYL